MPSLPEQAVDVVEFLWASDGASAKGGNEGQFAMKAKNSGCPSRAVPR
jgi:hypothetical protein